MESRRTLLLQVLVVIAGIILAYSNTLRAPFVLDDHSSIRNNLSLRQLWPPAAAEIGGTRGRPVANASFAFNYALHGDDVRGYHVVNLAIHAASALALLGLARRTLRRPGVPRALAGAADAIAAAAALLWAVHPLHTESVTYLSQRTELLMGFFYLSTLYGFVRGIDSPAHRRTWHGLAVLACLAGMASKEVMVTAPVAILLYDRTFVAGSFVGAWQARRGFYLALAGTWLVLAVLMIGLSERGAGLSLGITPLDYALTESGAVLLYLKLALWPAPLVFDYGLHAPTSFAAAWPCVLGLTVILLFVGQALRHRPKLGFLLAWPFLLLAPTSSVVPVALQPIAEHRMYLPLVAPAVLAAVLLRIALRSGASVAVALLALGLGLATYQRNAVYADEVALWADTLAKRPNNGRAHANIGAALLARGRPSEALVHLTRAIELQADDPHALTNLGLLHAQSARFSDAIACFQRALQASPGLAEAHYNLGCVLAQTGRTAEAGTAFQQAIRFSPQHADAHNNLGVLLARVGRLESAVAHFSEALRVKPRDAEIYANRADAYAKLDRRADAKADLERALRLRPDLDGARRQLESLR